MVLLKLIIIDILKPLSFAKLKTVTFCLRCHRNLLPFFKKENIYPSDWQIFLMTTYITCFQLLSPFVRKKTPQISWHTSFYYMFCKYVTLQMDVEVAFWRLMIPEWHWNLHMKNGTRILLLHQHQPQDCQQFCITSLSSDCCQLTYYQVPTGIDQKRKTQERSEFFRDFNLNLGAVH